MTERVECEQCEQTIWAIQLWDWVVHFLQENEGFS